MDYFYRYLTRRSALTKLHTHNYYEYFFVISGRLIHVINNKKETIEAGDFFFIRPDDLHGYTMLEDEQFEIINMNISSVEMERFCTYIGKDSMKILLEEAPYVKINLSKHQLNDLTKEHEKINFYSGGDGKVSNFLGDKDTLTVHLRFLLAKVMSLFINNFEYTKTSDDEDGVVYTWLTSVMNAMNSLENIKKGLPALLKLSGFSHGHLCVLMKKHFGITPLDFISDLRMIYASNLLENSNLDISTIAEKIGYLSTSHFIKSFKKKYGTTPYRYHMMKNNYNN